MQSTDDASIIVRAKTDNPKTINHTLQSGLYLQRCIRLHKDRTEITMQKLTTNSGNKLSGTTKRIARNSTRQVRIRVRNIRNQVKVHLEGFSTMSWSKLKDSQRSRLQSQRNRNESLHSSTVTIGLYNISDVRSIGGDKQW